jgi:lysophospholipase L1-like esterase
MKTSRAFPCCFPFCLLRLAVLLGLCFTGRAIGQPPAAADNRFEKNVQAYEAEDRLHAPPEGAILLVGDSQFFRWKTVQEDLKGYTIVNRGIDSFQSSDLLYFAARLVFPYRPRLIVIHVGGNDVHNGKPSGRVLADFKAFVENVRAVLPQVPIAFTSITPSPGRWDEVATRKAANQAVQDYIATQKNLHFIDLWDAMLTSEGKPREDLWVEDRVHPNHTGYLIRVAIMHPLLGAPDEKKR